MGLSIAHGTNGSAATDTSANQPDLQHSQRAAFAAGLEEYPCRITTWHLSITRPHHYDAFLRDRVEFASRHQARHGKTLAWQPVEQEKLPASVIMKAELIHSFVKLRFSGDQPDT